MRERGEPFKRVLNAAIRGGLTGARQKAAKLFKQPTFDMGEPLVDLTKALSLAAELEDTERWSVVPRPGRMPQRVAPLRRRAPRRV